MPIAQGARALLLLAALGGASSMVARISLQQRALDAMAASNAEALARYEEKELVGVKTGGVGDLIRTTRESLERTGAELSGYVARQGCLSVTKVLSPPTAAALLEYINAENVAARAEVDAERVPFEERFGGVNCRGPGRYGTRQDLFMPARAPAVRAALVEALTNLEPLLAATVGGRDAAVHEISSLVAEPGAPRQCIHADTIVLPCPQYPQASMAALFTFFIALQDVEDDMGHTVFLPRTHTPDAHLLWNKPQKQKEAFISVHKAAQSKLRLGDCAAFDSRILHCGRANTSAKRRVLFYFTLSAQREWPLPDGLHGSNSIRPEDKGAWLVSDLLATA